MRALVVLSVLIGLAGPAGATVAATADAGTAEDTSPASSADAATSRDALPDSIGDAGTPADVSPSPASPDAAPAGERVAPVPSLSLPAPPAAPDSATIEVIVVGTRVAHTGGSAHIIKNRQMERFEYDDPGAVLAMVPGVYARGEDGVGLRPNLGLRGVNPDRSKKVTLMEDGVLFGPAPYSAPAAYYFPLMTRMTQVRVVKGPAAISYGPQTIGGAVDLISRPIPSTEIGGLDLAGGQYLYRKAHGFYGNDDGTTGFLIEGVHLGSDGFKELPGGENTGFDRNEWMVKARRVFGSVGDVRNEVRLKLTYSDELSNETYLGLSDEDFRANPLSRYGVSKNDQMKNHRTTGALTHRLEIGPNFSVSTTAYRNDFKRTWRKVNEFGNIDLFSVLTNPNTPRNAVYHAILKGEADTGQPGEVLFIGPNQREFVSQGIESRVRLDATGGPVAHRAEFGVRAHHDRIARLHTQNGFTVIGGDLIPDGQPTEVTAFNEASSFAVALHATDAMTWKKLTLTPGVRAELIWSRFDDHLPATAPPDGIPYSPIDLRLVSNRTQHNTQVVLPGIAAYFAATPAFGLLAGVHRGFSPPTPDSSTYRPELSVNYEAGARLTTGRSHAEVVGYFNDYSNMTDNCTESSGCSGRTLDKQFDAGAARIWGVEVSAEHEFRAGPLRLPATLAYTLSRTEFLNTFQSDDPIFGNVKSGDEIPYVPRHQLNTSFGVEGNRGGVVAGMTYVARMREVAGSGPLSDTLATDAQWIFDANATWRMGRHATMYLNGRNLFDEHYIVGRRPFGARPNSPRWVQLGIKLVF